MKKLLFLFLLLSLFSGVLFSQIENYQLEYPHLGSSYDIKLDDDGFIWFPIAEENDFFRYEGQSTTALGLPEVLAFHTEEYLTENLIFFNRGLLIYSKNKISFLDLHTKEIEVKWEVPENLQIEMVYLDDNDKVWVFTKNENKTIRPVYFAESETNFNFAFDLFEHVGDKTIAWLYELNDADGLLYIYGLHGDLFLLNQKGERQDLFLNDAIDYNEKYECSVFRLDNKNKLWRFYRKDIEVYNKEDGTFIRYPLSGIIEVKSDCPENPMRGLRTFTIWEDHSGKHWFGGEGSFLMSFDSINSKSVSFTERLINDIGGKGGAVKRIIEDQFGNIYGIKRGGVFKVSEKGTNFESYLVDTKDKNHRIYKTDGFKELLAGPTTDVGQRTINASTKYSGEDSDGNLFFTSPRFIYELNAQSKEVEIIPFSQLLTNVGMYVQNDLKILAQWSHVYYSDKHNDFTPLKNSPSRLEDVLVQRNGNIWYSGFRNHNSLTGEYTSFLAKADDEYNYTETYKDPNGIVNFDSLVIFSMAEDDDSNVWLGTDRGCVMINGGDGSVAQKENRYTWKDEEISPASRSGFRIQYLGEDLFGFYNKKEVGIIDASSNELKHLFSKEELNVDKISTAYFSDTNHIWVGSKNQLSYLDFNTQEIIHFSHDLGLKHAGSIMSINQTIDNKIVLTSANGIFLFNPQELIAEHKQKLHQELKTKIKLNNYSFMAGDADSIHLHHVFSDQNSALVFDHNDKMLNFEFSLLNFTNPEEHTFSYWLDGYENRWTKAVQSNSLEYTNLPSGKYSLKVKAHTGNGVWSNELLEIPIIIKTAWYKTWWFIALCFLAIGVLSYLLFKHYLFLEKSKLQNAAQQEEAARLRELDDLKNIFFTNISHEFRTPLTVINGVNESSSATNKEKVMIRRNSNNLLQLINQILDLSKLESKKMSLHLVQSDIVVFIQYLSSSFVSLAHDRGIKLNFHSEEKKLIMNYDEARVQQIIYNLLSNALKFTEDEGEVSVDLSLVGLEKEKLSIVVSDSGKGIKEADQQFLFDHFYQASNSTSNVGEGSGVGLSLTKELVELMGGEISVKSELTVGSQFTVVLPINKELSPDLVPSTYIDGQQEMGLVPSKIAVAEVNVVEENTIVSDQRKPILLIIEDNVDIVSYIQNLLEATYQIVVAINGELGIAKAIEIIPDIIISDVMMPLKNGYEVCEALKQELSTDHIPIILLTAKASFEDRMEGLKYGADAYINKPFAKEELITRLEQLLLVRRKIQEKYKHTLIHSEESTDSEKDVFFNKLQQSVNENLMNINFGVPELAKALLMSQTQVYRKSKALIGQTPVVIIRTIRLNKSRSFLKDSGLSISDVASKTGFRDANYFARVFQKEYGKSPSQYRKGL